MPGSRRQRAFFAQKAPASSSQAPSRHRQRAPAVRSQRQMRRMRAHETGPLASQSPNGRRSYTIALFRKINNSRVTRNHGVRRRRLHGCFIFYVLHCVRGHFFSLWTTTNEAVLQNRVRARARTYRTGTHRAKCEYCCPISSSFFRSLSLSLTRRSEMHNNNKVGSWTDVHGSTTLKQTKTDGQSDRQNTRRSHPGCRLSRDDGAPSQAQTK